METRIQFRIDEETKRLAQEMAESQGMTLSEACRRHTELLAEQQRLKSSHDEWLAKEVQRAYAKLERGEAEFIDADTANERMRTFKQALAQPTGKDT
ncbi:damage-inducible protein J [Pseudidiomarina aquimaris]|uniref:Damage-inducible protein J n=1 Tax=Pseudidiomarina aquimaris TaxID=641841 RepID=A0A432XPF9_9GAMM|nr:type II toxin-antitoxin system RelB/DinJ family antitoxin [Pseudidiomarina aquimaris]RUO50606.1 damage-inducible protein J [Pseudidiomarina aquimaris]